MIRFMALTLALFLGGIAYGQGFPDAQKQPRFKEMRSQHKHYAKQARRKHIKRGTAYKPGNANAIETIEGYALAINRRKLVIS